MLAGIGPLLQRIGGLTRTIAHESIFFADDGSPTYPSYANMSYNFATADPAYFWSSLGLYGGAAVVESLLFPFESFTLSPWGKALFTAGVLFDTAGNALSLLSQYLRSGTAQIEYEYSQFDGGFRDLGKELDQLYDAYTYARIGSYSGWSLATVAAVAAPLVDGERSVAVSGSFQRILHYAGPVFALMGNLSSIISYNARLLVDERSAAYYKTDFSSDEDYYGEYETAYAFYFWSTIGSYGFWGLGALSSILAVILPERAPSVGKTPLAEPRPEPLLLLEPRGNGFYAGVRMAI